MKKQYDVLTALDTCVDCIITGENLLPEFGQTEKLVKDYTLEMGGSNCIFACQSASLGLKTVGVGVVGKDLFGDLVLNALRESGVEVAHIKTDPDMKTGLGVSFCRSSDRAIMTYLGTIDPENLESRITDLLPACRHLHIGSYFLMNKLRPFYTQIAQVAKKNLVTISLDTNWDPVGNWSDGLSELLPYVDIFFPNAYEAIAITGEKDADAAACKLCETVGVVALKKGSHGASVYSKGKHILTTGSVDVKVVDAIGAGDSFDAGFLGGFLSSKTLEECLQWGNICGSMSTRAAGGIRGQIHLEGLLNHLATTEGLY